MRIARQQLCLSGHRRRRRLQAFIRRRWLIKPQAQLIRIIGPLMGLSPSQGRIASAVLPPWRDGRGTDFFMYLNRVIMLNALLLGRILTLAQRDVTLHRLDLTPRVVPWCVVKAISPVAASAPRPVVAMRKQLALQKL